METTTHVLFGELELLDPNNLDFYLDLTPKGFEILNSEPLKFIKGSGEGYVFGQLFSGGYSKIMEVYTEGGSVAITNPQVYAGHNDLLVQNIIKYFNEGEKWPMLQKIKLGNPGLIWIGAASTGSASLYIHFDKLGNHDSIIIDSGCFFTGAGSPALENTIKTVPYIPKPIPKVQRALPIEQWPTEEVPEWNPPSYPSAVEYKSPFTTPPREPQPPPLPARPARNIQSPFTTSLPEARALPARNIQSPFVAQSWTTKPKTGTVEKIGKHLWTPNTKTLTYYGEYYFPESIQGEIESTVTLTPKEIQSLETQIKRSLDRYPGMTISLLPETKEVIINYTKTDLSKDGAEKMVKAINKIFSEAKFGITRKGETYFLYVK